MKEDRDERRGGRGGGWDGRGGGVGWERRRGGEEECELKLNIPQTHIPGNYQQHQAPVLASYLLVLRPAFYRIRDSSFPGLTVSIYESAPGGNGTHSLRPLQTNGTRK